MDHTILLSLTILWAAAALGTLFRHAARGTRMEQERNDRRSARRRRQITRQYRRERSGPGE